MVETKHNTKEHIWSLLEEIPDPEIPVVSIIDLGIVRKVDISPDGLGVVITPTYSGCPAMMTFEEDIKSKLTENGYTIKSFETTYSPAWSTDWISDEGLQKLEDYGIAPPAKSSKNKGKLLKDIEIRCPQCKSTNTSMISQFGSTACKSLHKCNDCLEPFDHFKCI